MLCATETGCEESELRKMIAKTDEGESIQGEGELGADAEGGEADERRVERQGCSEREPTGGYCARECAGGGQDERPGDMKKCQRNEICVQDCISVFGRAPYGRELNFAKLGTSQLCFDWKSATGS